MEKAVYIHAGAHRTGSSSFQMCLNDNRAVLEGAGFALAYPGRDGVPGGRLRLRLPRPRHGEKRLPRFASDLRAPLAQHESASLILSEENIPGPMRHFHDGQFYPAAGKRMRALRMALDAPPRHVIFVLRTYGDLFLSAYRKRAEDNAVPPFAELVPRFLAMDRGWPELVVEMQTALQPDRLTVVPYGARGESRALLARLVPGLDVAVLSEPDRAVNLSATDAALIALQTRYRAGETLPRRHWRQVIEDHAGDTAPRGFAAFSETDAARLEARYQADLARVAALPGLTFP